MTPRTSYTEREIKFGADLAFELPDLRRIVGSTKRLPQQSLRTSYFDSADLRLWERGITLRHRAGEGEEEESGTWTLKLPEEAEGTAVERTELTWKGPHDAPPAEAKTVLAGVLRRATLQRIVVLDSTRKRLVLRNDQGADLGEIDDDVVTVAKGTHKGLTFRQIELEFGDGHSPTEPTGSTVDAVIKKIRKAGARVERVQKFAKSLGLDGPPSNGAPGRLDRHSTVRDVVRVSITNGYERLLEHDYRLRLDPDDPPPHAVHQARVATRRLRSDLKTFGPFLDPVWLRNTTAELKWLGNRLGQVRDADVLAQRLAESGAEELRHRLADQRRDFSAELAEAIASDRYMSLLGRLHAGSHNPPVYVEEKKHEKSARAPGPDDHARDALPALVGRPWKRVRRRVHKAGRTPSDTQLHQIRIASKQLRYAAEAAEPVIGNAADHTARRAKDLQTVLGDHHDAVTAEEWLAGVARDGTGSAGFAAGQLACVTQRQQRQLRGKWRREWAALDTAKSTRWLR
jgi:CHAD domain-containing protein